MERYTKIACFGDIHGRDVIELSKSLLDNGIDRIVMLGDFLDDPSVIDFYRGDESTSGYDPLQSPIWIRPDWAFSKSLYDNAGIESNAYDCKLQFVGHTNSERIMEVEHIVFCDCLDDEYALITIDNESKLAQVEAIGRNGEYSRNVICC